MPVIREAEELQLLPDLDFSQLLDLPNTVPLQADHALSEPQTNLAPLMVAQSSKTCPSHPGEDNCFCHGFMGNWDLPEIPTVKQTNDADERKSTLTTPSSRTGFHASLDRRKNAITAPPEDLTAILLAATRTAHRECSLSNSQTLERLNYADGDPTFLDTLHLVDENNVVDGGHLTGIKPLHSKVRNHGTSTPTRFNDDAPGSTKRNGIRFPKHALKILRDWLDEHSDHPYPSEDEKAELQKRTELKPSQIANWLANARRRRKATEKARPKICMSPSLRPTTAPIDILSDSEKPWDELNPFERWKHSPPEHEPASITDIAQAVANSDLPEDPVSRSPSSGRRKRSSNGSGFSSFGAPSTTSLETSAQSSSLSASSAAFSQGSSNSHGSFGSFSSSLAGKKDRRRRRRAVPATKTEAFDDKRRIFQCTFCTDTFKSKYDWTRHEKSLHLSLEKWICAPLGPVMQASGVRKCVYCDTEDPSDEHIDTHNHRQCEFKGNDARTFYRKDHLRQHLRLMHGSGMKPYMDQWKTVAVSINSRCGFCAQRFNVWQERVDHLTAHFKTGARMIQWKGCRGLDPAVAAQVTNAMPPYLIGIESVSPNPFSASNQATWRQQMPSEQDDDGISNLKEAGDIGPACEPFDSGNGTKVTCWEILTVKLGKYANEMAEQGRVLSDEMLQQQARRILYDSDDSWNQTAADNPEWLDLFKKAHGLDFIPSELGGQGLQVPEDLETYGDLGLRIPFQVQLAAYNEAQAGTEISDAAKIPGPYSEALDRKKQEFRSICSLLSKEGVLLHRENIFCEHEECAQTLIDVSTVDEIPAPGPRYKRWCTYTVAPAKAKQLTKNSTATWEGATSLQAAKSRAQCLDNLGQLHGPMTCDCDDAATTPSLERRVHQPRHKLQLSLERARLFESTTGAWEDAGKMPVPTHTADLRGSSMLATGRLADVAELPATGTMMDSLGLQLNEGLPFCQDVAVSMVPVASTIPSGSTWNLQLTSTPLADDQALKELDKMIAADFPVQGQAITGTAAAENLAMHSADEMAVAVPESLPTTLFDDFSNDVAMDDFSFDDVTFDGAFDLPLEGNIENSDTVR